MKRQGKESQTKISSFSIPKVADAMLTDLSKLAGVTKSLFLTILLNNLLPLPSNKSLIEKILVKSGQKDKEILLKTINALAKGYGFQIKEKKESFSQGVWSITFLDPKTGSEFEVTLLEDNFKLKRFVVKNRDGEEVALMSEGKLSAQNVPLNIIGFIMKIFN
ncbi:hypothetical protein [Phorcysia thermohydrogeniphila]|uniref:Uncharacterized protein n=1 Tax=Phorcysia thermohydrogeniphila TaxID=936138 RepID=A0A4R1GEH7_9BACT|nr:hypothetical protein [Phorcysia thermohydrogeniphila]TCK06624.1 hypothetical protein CLV27_0427 [Phorcysia thermohydrogeniphila]